MSVSFGMGLSYSIGGGIPAPLVPVSRVSPYDGGAIAICHRACLIISGDRIQNPQEIVTVSSAIQQDRGKFKSHDKMSISVV